MKSKAYLIALYLLLIGLGAVRLIYLRADPPNYSFMHAVADEGRKTFNARNMALFGRWNMDSSSPFRLYLHPVFTLIEYLSFKFFGVGLFQARIVSVVFGLSTIVIFYLLIKKWLPKEISLLATLLFGYDFTLIMFNRLALHETLAIFFMLTSLYFWEKGRENPRYSILSGISVLVAILVKPYALFLIPCYFIISIFLHNKQDKSHRRISSPFLNFIFGILFIVTLWFFILFFFKQSIIFKEIFSLYSMFLPNSILGKVPHFDIQDINGTIMHYLLINIGGFLLERPIAAILIFFYFLSRLFNKSLKTTGVELSGIVWLVTGIMFFLPTCFNEIFRNWYLVILTPPLYILFGIYLSNLHEGHIKLWPEGFSGFPATMFLVVINQLILYSFLSVSADGFSSTLTSIISQTNPDPINILFTLIKSKSLDSISYLNCLEATVVLRYYTIIGSLLLSICLFTPMEIIIVRKMYPNSNLQSIVNSKSNLAIILFSIFHLTSNGYRYYEWARHPKYSIYNSSRYLGEILNNSNAILIGADYLCLENKLIHFNYYNNSPENARKIRYIAVDKNSNYSQKNPESKVVGEYGNMLVLELKK